MNSETGKFWQIVRQYFACVFGQVPIDNLATISSNKMIFEGPLFSCTSVAAYIDALKKDPLSNASYEIIKYYENDHSACVIFQFNKPGINTRMAQIFEFEGNKIQRISLIFNKADVESVKPQCIDT